MTDDGKRPSPLAGLAPPGMSTPAVPPERPVPAALDEAAEVRDEPAAGWAEIAGAALGLAGIVPSLAVAAPPVAHVKVVDRPEPEAFRATILDALAAPALRMELTIAIEGVSAAQAGEIAAAIDAAVRAAAPAAAAPDADGARLYRLAGTAGEVAKLAGEILGEIGKAGLGVVAGVGLVRTLRKLLLRKDEQPPEAPAGDVLTIAVTIGPEKKPDGPSASAALKELKEAADGLTALGKLLARGS